MPSVFLACLLGISHLVFRACRKQAGAGEPACRRITLEVTVELKNVFKYWAGATRPSIPFNLGYG